MTNSRSMTRIDISEAERIPGWMTAEELRWLADAATRACMIIEIGCWKGRSTKALATHTDGVVYAVDHWRLSDAPADDSPQGNAHDGEAVHAEFIQNLQPELAAGKVVVVRAGSEQAMPLLRELLNGRLADMAFIDGDHRYESVKRDIQNCRALLRDGGLLAGHDYGRGFPGVTAAVDELVRARLTNAAGSIWSCRMSADAQSPRVRSTLPLLDLEQLTVRRLEREADDLRKRGLLDEARDGFAKLLSAAPHQANAARLLASLTGQSSPVPATPGAFDPAPFVRVPHFLPQDIHDRLLHGVFELAGRFEAANVGRVDIGGRELRHVDESERRSRALRGVFDHLEPALGDRFRERLAECFERITTALAVPLRECQPRQIRALLYRDGDFFKAHRDHHADDTRLLTFLYYLYKTPRPFSGGDLVLYDTWVGSADSDPSASTYNPVRYTRLPCNDNELICFPSEYFHEALPVQAVTASVDAARIAITGWFHS